MLRTLVLSALVAASVALSGYGTRGATMVVTASGVAAAQSGTVISVAWHSTRPGRPDTITLANASPFAVDYALGFYGQPAGDPVVHAGEYDGSLTAAVDGQPSDTWFSVPYVAYTACFFTGGVSVSCGVGTAWVAYGGRSYVVTLASQD